MALGYSSSVGAPPVCTSLAFLVWLYQHLEYQVGYVSSPRVTTYYVSNSAGSDANNGLTTGAPFKTLAKAQTIITANNASPSAGGIAILFKRGDVWSVGTSLASSAPHVALGAYGSGVRPIFSAFTLSLTKGSWAANSGVYRYSTASDIAWIRDQNDVLSPWTRVDTLAKCQANQKSFFYDSVGQFIYARFPNDANPLFYAQTEAVITNNISGIQVSGDDTLVFGLRVDGYGMSSQVAGSFQAYAIQVSTGGTDLAVVADCEGYYTSWHAMGHFTTSGGLSAWIRCRAAWANNDGAGSCSIFIEYAGSGGQECAFWHCVAAGGGAPEMRGSFDGRWGFGNPFEGHTTTGIQSLVYTYGCSILAGQFMCNIPSAFSNVPAWSDIKDCRAFRVGEKWPKVAPLDVPTPGGIKALVCGVPQDVGTITINCQYLKYWRAWDTAFWMQSVVNDGTHFNATIDIGMAYGIANANTGGIVGELGNGTSTRYYNSEIRLNVPQTYFGINFIARLGGTAGDLVAIIKNSIVTFITNPLTSSITLGITNTAGNLSNNAYDGMPSTGYSTDAAAVQVGYPVSGAAGRLSSLYGAGGAAMSEIGGYDLQYDANERPRTNHNIGAFEASSLTATAAQQAGNNYTTLAAQSAQLAALVSGVNVASFASGLKDGSGLPKVSACAINGNPWTPITPPLAVTLVNQGSTITYVTAIGSGQSTTYTGDVISGTLNYPFALNRIFGGVDLTGWTQVVFVAKAKQTDADATAIVTVKLSNPGAGSDGLTYLNGAAPSSPTTAADGSMTVTITPASGTVPVQSQITMNLTARGMGISTEQTLFWELAWYLAGVKQGRLDGGTFSVAPSVRANPVAS